MSDKREISMREYDKKLFYVNLKLGTHQKFESKNSLYALPILYPLLLQWQKTLSENLSEKF